MLNPIRPWKKAWSKARLYRRAGTHAPREADSERSVVVCALPGRQEQNAKQCRYLLSGRLFAELSFTNSTYEARDPMVMGLGFAATRDLISYLRYNTRDANPLFDKENKTPRWAIGFGSSQSGRFLKDLIYQGFNQDEAGQHRLRRRDSAHLGVAPNLYQL